MAGQAQQPTKEVQSIALARCNLVFRNRWVPVMGQGFSPFNPRENRVVLTAFSSLCLRREVVGAIQHDRQLNSVPDNLFTVKIKGVRVPNDCKVLHLGLQPVHVSNRSKMGRLFFV